MTDEERQDAPEGIEDDMGEGPAAETGGGRAAVRAHVPDRSGEGPVALDGAGGPDVAPGRTPGARGGQGRGGRGGRREGDGPSRGRSQGRQQRSRTTVEVDVNAWKPRTRLGQLVKEGKITSLSQALGSGLPLREAMVVDIFLPEIEDDVLDINMVQRMTDSGRRVKFSITTVVGDRNGFIGMGRAKGKEVGPTIRKAIDNAKLNIIEVRRGCGSWDCGCGGAHSLPYAVTGKAGSVEVTLKPAPRGAGLSAGDVAQRILSLAGFQDVRSFARGQTRTTVNFAAATFEALVSLTRTRAPPGAESGPDAGPVQAEAPAGGE